MKCPVDRAELVEELVGSTGFASCPECGGLWLPHSARVDLVDPQSLSQATRRVPEERRVRRKYRACPRCKISMAAQTIEGIEIDRCMTCDGIWLDAGEYDAVRHRIGIEASDGPQQIKKLLGTDGAMDLVFEAIFGLLQFWD
jgi:Zn-finger nucleic acid-binding protein